MATRPPVLRNRTRPKGTSGNSLGDGFGEESMSGNLTRRDFVRASAAAGSLALLANKRAVADAPVAVRWASLQPGFTVLPVQYILANKLGQRSGIELPDPSPYTAVSTYYNDFIAGNYDI